MSIFSILESLISMLTALMLFLGSTSVPNVNPGEYFVDTETVQTIFDEGEFKMGEYDIIVSPLGDDSNQGTLESPLKTMNAAKERLKLLKGKTDEAVTVWFREGTYLFTEAMSFGEDDLNNVVFRSYPDEDVIFTGSVEITGWTETKINSTRAFVTAVNTNEMFFRSLFKGDERLSVSKWPKSGSFKVTDSLEEDTFDPDNTSGFFDLHAAFFTDKTYNFANLSDVNVRIMHKWCDDILPLHSVNTETGRVEFSKPAAMTVEVGDNFVYENVREALTEPGEWYLDRTEGKLYYIPEKSETTENFVLSAPVTEEFFNIENVSGITFNGIDFKNTDWDFVSGTKWHPITNSEHPLYENIKYNPTHPQAAFEGAQAGPQGL